MPWRRTGLLARQWRFLRMLRAGEMRGLPPPSVIIFNEQTRHVIETLVERGLVRDNPGLRVTAAGKLFIATRGGTIKRKRGKR